MEIGDRKDGQQDEQDAQTVHAHGEADVPAGDLDPGEGEAKLQVGVGLVEQGQHPDGQAEGHQRGEQRRPAQGILPFGRDEEQDQHAHQREEGHQNKRIGDQVHVYSSDKNCVKRRTSKVKVKGQTKDFEIISARDSQ